MRHIGFLMFGLATVVVGCGSDAGGGPDRPAPNPTVNDFCAAQHIDGDVTVCDALYEEAPFVHLPKSDETHAFAALKGGLATGGSFVTEDGQTFPYNSTIMTDDPELRRHAVAIYELSLSGGKVTSFKPAILFDESVFVAPFMGRAFEGTISRRDSNGQYAWEPSLPVRVEILDEALIPSQDSQYEAKMVIANLEHVVTAADGSCMPALSSYGVEAPFDAGATVTLGAGRFPSMHTFGDDEFTISLTVNGESLGILMGPAWFRGPADLIGNTLSASGTYTGTGHGAPGYHPGLELDPVTGGGNACTTP